MTSFIVRFKFKEEDRPKVDETMRNLTPPSREEPGCVTYISHWSKEDPNSLVIYEQYVDEAAFESHKQSPHFQKYGVPVLLALSTERVFEFLDMIV